MRAKTFVGLDIGSYSIKAVAIGVNKGRLTLQGFAQQIVGEQDQAIVVRQVLDYLGVKPKALISSVSGRSVIVRQVETVRLAEEELLSHMTYEADKYIPFSSDEVVLDCCPLPELPDSDASNMDVLLVAVRKSFVEDHVNLINSAGAHPMVVDVDVFALCNAFWALGPTVIEDYDEAETVALVDIGASKSWVAIVRGRRLLFQREIYLAGNEITDSIVRAFNEPSDVIEEVKANPGDTLEALLDAALPAFEDLANEVRLSFDYVEGQFDRMVDRVVLSGGSSLLSGMPDILGNILGRPVQVFDPLNGLDLITSRYDLHGLEENSPALTVALGLACNQLPETISGLGGGELVPWNNRRGGSGMPMTSSEQRDVPTVPAPAPISPGVPAAPLAPAAPTPPQGSPLLDETSFDSLAPPPPPGSPGAITPAALPPAATPPPAPEPSPMAPLAMPDTGYHTNNNPPPISIAPADAGQDLHIPTAPDLGTFDGPPSHDLSGEVGLETAPMAMPNIDNDDPYADQSGHHSSMLVVLEDDDDDDIDDSDTGRLPPLPS